MIASCGFLEKELRQFKKKCDLGRQRGNSVSRSENKRKKAWSKREKARRKKRNVRFSITKKNKTFRKNYRKLVSRN